MGGLAVGGWGLGNFRMKIPAQQKLLKKKKWFKGSHGEKKYYPGPVFFVLKKNNCTSYCPAKKVKHDLKVRKKMSCP